MPEYRSLGPYEIIRKGDEWCYGEEGWQLVVNSIGNRPRDWSMFRFRRHQEADPMQNPKGPGAGYRFLSLGEIVQAGDEWWDGVKWMPSKVMVESPNGSVDGIRRKLPPITAGRMCDTCACQARQGEACYWCGKHA